MNTPADPDPPPAVAARNADGASTEQELLALFDLMPEGVVLVDPQTTRAVRFNAAAHRQLGYGAEEFARLRVSDYEADHTPEQTRASIDALMRNGRVDFETRLRRKDGTLMEVSVSGVRMDTGGRPRFMAVLRDITERRRAQEQMRLSSERLNEAQRIAQVGSWELDLVTGRLVWSDEIFNLFELDKTRFGATYEAFLQAIHPEDRDAVDAAYSRSLADRAPYEIVHRLRMTDGRIKWVHERCTSAFDAAGKPLRSVGTVQDITARRQVEMALEQLNHELEQRVRVRTVELEEARQEAERASQAKSDFLSRMSHELRTPMNAILGFGQLLEADEDQPLNPEQRENVHEMLRAGRHLLELINEMLDLARVESGRLDLSPEPVELAPLLRECLSLVRPLAEPRRIGLNAAAVYGLVQADRLRLRQVLLNLLSNAIKYNREGGEVELSCAPGEGGRLRIAVRDTGHGIAPGQLPRLFKPFERLESAYKGIEGTGIGLALTRRLAEAMDGAVGVSSVVGAGSTFWVELPAVAPTALAMQAQGARTPAAQARVLYVEDNPLNRQVMEQIFTLRPEFTLRSAHTAEAGIDLARAEVPALILMDINLPGMDGYQTLGVLKADPATAQIPVLAVSASAMPGDRERGLKAGFADYVSKPLDVPQFLDLMDRLLGGAAGAPGSRHEGGKT